MILLDARPGRSGPPGGKYRTPTVCWPTPWADPARSAHLGDRPLQLPLQLLRALPQVFDKHYEFLPHAELLSFEEITRGTCVRGPGVEKIRITGGEPRCAATWSA